MQFLIVEDVHESEAYLVESEEVFKFIRGGKLKGKTEQVRAEPDKAKRAKLKVKLFPAIYPGFIGSGKILNENSVATGVIQYDVDTAVEQTDYDHWIAVAKTIPCVLYVHRSPSNKMKLALKSDFAFDPSLSLEENKLRFVRAYDRGADYLHQWLEVEFDDSADSISQASFLCHDPDAYFNPDCETFEVNELCVVEAAADPVLPTNSGGKSDTLDSREVTEMLSFIPRDLTWHERRPINFAVLYILGEPGIGLLEFHWIVDDKAKLSSDLRGQLRAAKRDFTANLCKIAMSFGWRPDKKPEKKHVRGWDTRKLKAELSDHVFAPMLSVPDGEKLMRETVSNFFKTGESTVIRASMGFGKTTLALQEIAKLPYSVNVLILCSTHKLVDENYKKLNRLIGQHRKKTGFKHMTSATVVRGKGYVDANGHRMCENGDAYEKFHGSIPTDFCMTGCMRGAVCDYTTHINPLANIRLAATEELYNAPGAFWCGIKLDAYDNAEPADRTWEPDFIVVDETCLRFDTEKVSPECKFASLRAVLSSMEQQKLLSDAIDEHRSKILSDFKTLSPEKNAASGSKTLRYLADYVSNCVSAKELHRDISCSGGELHLCRYRTIADRYQTTPILHLDATADEHFMKEMFPSVRYVDISVKSKPDINVYQTPNFCGSKKILFENEDVRNRAIAQIKALVERDQLGGRTAGLITYKSIRGCPDFALDVAEQVGVKLVRHFGNLRGTNEFENVDCLIILGRNYLDEKDLKRRGKAFFGESISTEKWDQNVPVRMKAGSAMSLSNHVFKDDRLRHMHDQLAKSETKQAVGRARLIHGQAKDVYIFTNESLGADVEITGFFDFDYGNFTEDFVISENEKAFEFRQSELKRLGFTSHRIRTCEDQIRDFLKRSGFEFWSVTYKTKDYKVMKDKEWCARPGQNLADFIKGNITEKKPI